MIPCLAAASETGGSSHPGGEGSGCAHNGQPGLQASGKTSGRDMARVWFFLFCSFHIWLS